MIITSDLHLTDRLRDEYRWEFLAWLKGQIKKLGEKQLFILGDLTDAKDGHSARLVNRIIDTLRAMECNVTVSMGNHDYLDPTCPFFRFLNFNTDTGRLRFVSKPTRVMDKRLLILPHSRDPVAAWGKTDLEGAEAIFCHQTFNGATVEGYELKSPLSSTYWNKERKFRGLVLSGDVHVPQKIGCVEYVGSPYPVAFGDSFTPRVVVISDNFQTVKTIEAPAIKRLRLKIRRSKELMGLDIKPGDQAKIELTLSREYFADWDRYKTNIMRRANELGLQVFSLELREIVKKAREQTEQTANTTTQTISLSPSAVLRDFCAARGIDKAQRRAALELIRGETRHADEAA